MAVGVEVPVKKAAQASSQVPVGTRKVLKIFVPLNVYCPSVQDVKGS